MINHFTQRSFNAALMAALVLGGAGFGANSYAVGTSTSNLAVSATVDATCTLNTGGGVAFGSYDAGNGSSAQGTITVLCGADGTASTVTLGQGLHDLTGTAAAPARNMDSGAAQLAYNLYQDMNHTVLWGNTPLTGKAVTGSTDGTQVTVYGFIPANQGSPIGAYSDTVVATVTF